MYVELPARQGPYPDFGRATQEWWADANDPSRFLDELPQDELEWLGRKKTCI